MKTFEKPNFSFNLSEFIQLKSYFIEKLLSEIDEKDHRHIQINTTNVIAKKTTKPPLKHSGGGSTKRNSSGNSRLESEPTFDRTVSAVEPTSYHRRQSNFSSSTTSNLQPTISTASIPSQSSLNFDFYLIHIFNWKIRQDTFLKVVLVL